ncbi:Tripartite tricarboxylate transporter TctB family protein (plasmid) [Sulfitobacter sp. THAF37]|uniref:tripartite tricarboxylate transporter TctB family protein n=1 Tax=Sulfitobacter sp. THAF37 TaxID=2587855 RepID=UPI00126847F1|nr:tripartite tricarboxylate transporter TctB family protein [Sulfitobacter sp. THAF37]QFT60856.1 Tripartite tricarboxylate transporter TctB family protein [Sulfitobacter sp. THAF37]
MVDRIFAGVLLIVTLAYSVIAFTTIKAPFQYDPLGPESWPQILSLVAIACLLMILWKPDMTEMDVARQTWFRLAATIVMLCAYAELYEPLGFILATILFGTALCAMLGAGILRSVVFGIAAGIGGYLLCVTLLDLNLPEGELIEYMLQPSSQEEGAS